MYIQDMIFRLNDFWRVQGCALLPSYDLAMGAATFHPATALRVLKKEAWRAAYLQGCRRPSDGRYGDNPNRLQHYYQYQVVMKPSPATIRQDYLDSLTMLGIKEDEHDILFLEDDWESPTLGAWGLGWEVRCDGMEVSQFTYFQQMGGLDCAPITAELTYGIERLALFLQKKNNIFELQWSEDLSYRELFAQNEREQSHYNFERSDPANLVAQFKKEEGRVMHMLDDKQKGGALILPAWESCICASHLFNLMDARGLIGVSERQHYIARIRALARQVAEAWCA